MSTTPSITNPIKVTLVVGAPGSGKGTISAILARKTRAYHLSVGDYLRSLKTISLTSQALGGLTNHELKQYLSNHELVPNENIVAILWYKLCLERRNGWKKFIIDGFPRDVDSGVLFEQIPGLVVKSVLFFDCPKEVCKERFLGRKRESTDSGDVFEKRYQEFEENNAEVVERWREELVVVDSSGETRRTMRLLREALERFR